MLLNDPFINSQQRFLIAVGSHTIAVADGIETIINEFIYLQV